MTKPWEHMSRDEKLDDIKRQLDDMKALLDRLVSQPGGKEKSSTFQEMENAYTLPNKATGADN